MEELQQQLREAEERALQYKHERDLLQQRLAPTMVRDYLALCHELHGELIVIKDSAYGTTGATTDPTGRFVPARIIPWKDGFSTLQKDVWDILGSNEDFLRSRSFPSRHNMDYLRGTVAEPISSEQDVRYFAASVLEQPVKRLVEEVYKNNILKEHFKLPGLLAFQSHMNGITTQRTPLDEVMQQLSISDVDDTALPPVTPIKKGRGGGRADQFCLLEVSNESGTEKKYPVAAIEYKAPHKLPTSVVTTGSTSEIRPAEEIIDKEIDEKNLELTSKAMVAAVITQAFSYMIIRGVCYGYVYTGEVLIFLQIPYDDPEQVYFSVSIPKPGDSPFASAVGQVTAFLLRALAAKEVSQSWTREAKKKLKTWPVEYDDVLAKIPQTAGTDPDFSAYKPEIETMATNKQQLQGNHNRSPILTRSRTRGGCREAAFTVGLDSASDDEPSTPTVKRNPRGGRQSQNQRGSRGKQKRGSGGSRGKRNAVKDNNGNGKDNSTHIGMHKLQSAPKPTIESRPYCTHKCLLGILNSLPLDHRCPNFSFHKSARGHITPRKFLQLLSHQLLVDDGPDADCKPLHIVGSRGALFKVCLSSYGYTLVTKGMEAHNLRFLQNENRVYEHMFSLQGDVVPVCLGIFNIEIPWYYNGGAYVNMLCLSWAGVSLSSCRKPAPGTQVADALKALHSLGVLHNDAERRNILRDVRGGEEKIMFVDFERAEIRERERSKKGVLTERSGNLQTKGNRGEAAFELEFYRAAGKDTYMADV